MKTDGNGDDGSPLPIPRPPFLLSFFFCSYIVMGACVGAVWYRWIAASVNERLWGPLVEAVRCSAGRRRLLDATYRPAWFRSGPHVRRGWPWCLDMNYG